MKNLYIKPEVDVILMETQLPMAMSLADGEADGSGAKSNESRGTWGDLLSE